MNDVEIQDANKKFLIMRYLICLLLLAASPGPITAEIRLLPSPSCWVKEPSLNPQKQERRFFWKRHRPLDQLAVVAVCLHGVPVVATLVTYWGAGGFAAGFVLYLSSIFSLVGMALGAIALIRAAFLGWRRGTFWAILALVLPPLFLLVVGLLA